MIVDKLNNDAGFNLDLTAEICVTEECKERRKLSTKTVVALLKKPKQTFYKPIIKV